MLGETHDSFALIIGVNSKGGTSHGKGERRCRVDLCWVAAQAACTEPDGVCS